MRPHGERENSDPGGVEPTTSRTDDRYSTNRATRPEGSWSWVINPIRPGLFLGAWARGGTESAAGLNSKLFMVLK